MLLNISIRNFALVKELDIDLKKGLNIITGETGAGKSVIIEAISMALGSRADTSYVRTGSDKAIVSLLADTDDCKLGSFLQDIGVPDDNPLVITREISSVGKSICRINGSVVPLSSLNSLCKKIADIHGQYDQQTLLDENNHINILDLFGGSNLLDLKEKVKEKYNQYISASSELFSLKKSISESERQRDFLKFELSEIKAANIVPGEDEELEESINLMQNSETLFNALSSSCRDLYTSDSSATSVLGKVLSELEEIKSFSKDLNELYERFSSVYYELDDMNSSFRHLRESVTFSPEDLNSSIERLEILNKLKRKYGGSLEAVAEYADKAQNSLNNIENADEQINKLEKEITALNDQFKALAAKLSEARKDAAVKLEAAIDKELLELNFNNAHFKVSFKDAPSSESGTDNVLFLISANLGEDPKPLAKVASGGELSRIMLALKRIIGDLDSIPTMIFDEIDTGISGQTAAVVGDKLESIANNHQVICITHLPQIACRGDNHLKIEKHSDDISTKTSVKLLSYEERIEEIARMLSGTNITESARLQAKELLG